MTPQEWVDTELKLVVRMFDRLQELRAMFVMQKDGQRKIAPVIFGDTEEKDIMNQFLKALVKVEDPDFVVYISEAWKLEYGPDELPEEVTRPRDHPNRIECVVVQMEFRSGEKFNANAKILRKGKKAWLDKFEVHDASRDMGRFVDFYPQRGH